MARIRTIKPEFFRHEELQDIELANPGKYAMLVFAGIWGHCDSKGRFEYRPRQLKLDILPFIPFDMSETIQILCDAGMIVLYSVDEKRYGFIPTFEKHQRLSGKEANEGEKYPGIEKANEEQQVKQRGSNGEATGKFQNFTNVQEGKGREGNRNMEEEGECRGETKKPDDNAELDVSRTAVASRGVKPRASAMKANFELPESWRDWCKTYRPELNPDAVADEFRDYWLGNGKRMIDWQATWRNWVRRQAPPKSSTQAKPRNSGNAGAVTEALERFRHRATIIEGECYDA